MSVVPDDGVDNPRDTLLAAAVKFLLHPRVARATVHQQRSFLLRKGLSSEDVDEAFARALDVHRPTWNRLWSASWPIQPFSRSLLPPSLLHALNVIVVVFGGGYIVYIIIKYYVWPWLTARPYISATCRRIKQLESRLSLAESANSELQHKLRQIEYHSASDTSDTQRQVKELQCEIASLKSLLLNRHQFPSIPCLPPLTSTGAAGPDDVEASMSPAAAVTTSTSSSTRIPAWQHARHTDHDNCGECEAKCGATSSASSGDIIVVSGNNSDELSDN